MTESLAREKNDIVAIRSAEISKDGVDIFLTAAVMCVVAIFTVFVVRILYTYRGDVRRVCGTAHRAALLCGTAVSCAVCRGHRLGKGNTRCIEDASALDTTDGSSSSSSLSSPSLPSSLPSRLAAKARSSGSGITRHSIGRLKSRGFSQLQEDDHAEEADAAEEKAAAVELELASLDVVVSDDLRLSPSSSCSSSHQPVGNTGDGDACAGDRGDGDGDGVGGSGGSGSGGSGGGSGSGSGGALYRTLDTELTGEEATSPTMGPPVEGGDEEGGEDAALAGNLAAEESNDGDFTVAVELSADGEEGVDGEGKHTEGGDVPGEEGGGAVGGTALTRVASTMGEFEV